MNHASLPEDLEAERLVRDNMGWMLKLAERLLLDKGLAEDVVQDAFLAAFRGLDGFESRSSLKTWLHRITVNAALMKLRQLKRLAEEPIEDYLPEFDQHDCRIEARWTQLVDVAAVVEDQRRSQLVRDAIAKLPDAYRVVMQLRDLEGYATAEVAEALELTESNVKVRLHRARAALKKLLEPILRGEVS